MNMLAFVDAILISLGLQLLYAFIKFSSILFEACDEKSLPYSLHV